MAVREAAVAALPEKIYVFGGKLADGRATSEIQEYDRATQRSVIAGQLPQPFSEASAVTLDGVIYLLGGRVRRGASEAGSIASTQSETSRYRRAAYRDRSAMLRRPAISAAPTWWAGWGDAGIPSTQ